MAATIGIKVANGDFYSILEEHSAVKKRLVLTTVHDNQKSVQIDLYKSFARTMADALYIGSLVVDNISPAKKGEPAIEMTISSTIDGAINADSVDLGNPGGERQQLSLHLKSFEEEDADYSDFEMEEAAGSGGEEQLFSRSESTADPDYEKPGIRWPFIIGGLILLLLILFALWFFLVRGRSADEAKSPVKTESVPAKGRPDAGIQKTEPPKAEEPPRAPASEPQAAAPAASESEKPPARTAEKAETPKKAEAPAKAASAPKAASGTAKSGTAKSGTAAAGTAKNSSGVGKKAEPRVISEPAKAPPGKAPQRDNRDRPVYGFKAPQNIPPEGIVYKVRWGDTLWDIAEVFYRNPWLYTSIVRHNSLRNPNLIVSGTEITVPPKE